VARFADEFNRSSATPDRLRRSYERIREACVAIGRDPDEVVRSAMIGTLVADTEAELEARVHDQLRMLGSDEGADAWLADRRGRWIMGTPEQAHEQIRTLEDAGAQRIMLQDFLPRDLDMIALLGRIAAG
jgi:alkanesulfonate monooxygenase